MLCIEVTGAENLQIEMERKPVQFGCGGLAWANGSWKNNGPLDDAGIKDLEGRKRKIFAEMPGKPRSEVTYGEREGVRWLLHALPNMSYAVAVAVQNPDKLKLELQTIANHPKANVWSSSFSLAASSEHVRILVAIATSREASDPIAHALGLLRVAEADASRSESHARRFLYGLIVRCHMKQNGLRALTDPRHSDEICRASLVEAANAHTAATTETLLQSWPGEVRVFPCARRGRCAFRNLRAGGGLIVSAEAIDGHARWVRVKALNKADARLVFPGGGRVVSLRLEPGEIWEQGRPSASPTRFPRRTAPRRVLIESAEKLGSFAQYPEDLPFGQTVRDKFLYLGSPGAFGGRRSLPSLGALHRRANSRRWENRLEAARLLARHKGNPRAIAMLEQLSKDTVFLVAHVAGSVSSECAI